jgi:hypothetical protein
MVDTVLREYGCSCIIIREGNLKEKEEEESKAAALRAPKSKSTFLLS